MTDLTASSNAEPRERYRAFISYRHADNHQPGRQWATWLHQALETYEVPADLVGSLNQRGELIPERIFPIFRDEDELPAHANLGDSIVLALAESELLLVICSPAAVASTYVATEIERFKQMGRSDRILAVIIDGEPNASWDQSKWDDEINAESECFPLPLQFEYSNGEISETRAEPIAADFRVNEEGYLRQGWTNPEAYRQQLVDAGDLDRKAIDERVASYSEQQQLMLLKIVAGVLAVPLGQLTQRDRAHQLKRAELRSRRLRRWLYAVSTLAIAALIAGVVAVKQTLEAKQKTHAAEVASSGLLAGESTQALQRSDYELALKRAVEALPSNLDDPDRGYAAEAEAAMIAALNRDKLVFRDQSDSQWTDHDALRKDPYVPQPLLDNARLVLSGRAAPILIDMENHRRIPLQGRTRGGLHWSEAVISADQRTIAAATYPVVFGELGRVMLWSSRDGTLLLERDGTRPSFVGSEGLIAFESDTGGRTSVVYDFVDQRELGTFAGAVKYASVTAGFVIAEKAAICTTEKVTTRAGWETVRRRCTDPEIIKYSMSGEPLGRVIGELVHAELNDGYLLVASPKAKRGTVSSMRKQGVANVSKLNLADFSQVQIMQGRFEVFESETHRLITRDVQSGQLSLWDAESGELLSQVEAQLLRKEYADLSADPVEIHFDHHQSASFVVIRRQQKDNEEHTVWYLSDGAVGEFIPGLFVGLLPYGYVVTSVQRESQTDIYYADAESPRLTMPNVHCGDNFSASMPKGHSPTILFECTAHLAAYFPEIGYMRFIQTSSDDLESFDAPSRVEWVSGGESFSIAGDLLSFWAPMSWQGGTGDLIQWLTVKPSEGVSYHSVQGHLLELSETSEIRLWKYYGSNSANSATIDEEELRNEFEEQLEPEYRDDALANREKKIQGFEELGFSVDTLQTVIRDTWNSYEAAYNNEGEDTQDDWRFAVEVSAEAIELAESIGFTPEWQIDINATQTIVGSETKAVLLDSQRGGWSAELASSEEYVKFGIEWFGQDVGALPSPSGEGFVFFNMFSAALFDDNGKVVKTLCEDQRSCPEIVELQWVGNGSALLQTFSASAAPLLFSMDSRSEVDICKAMSNSAECARLYSGGLLLGKQHIVTQHLMVDLETALPLTKLDQVQSGFGGTPVQFNDDESAVLFLSESGGGTLVLEAWALPQRGQAVLKQATERIERLYSESP